MPHDPCGDVFAVFAAVGTIVDIARRAANIWVKVVGVASTAGFDFTNHSTENKTRGPIDQLDTGLRRVAKGVAEAAQLSSVRAKKDRCHLRVVERTLNDLLAWVVRASIAEGTEVVARAADATNIVAATVFLAFAAR